MFLLIILQFSLLEGKVVTEIDLPDAAFGNMAPYQWAGSTDFDISYDECGLWVIYATLQNSLDIGTDKLLYHLHEASCEHHGKP